MEGRSFLLIFVGSTILLVISVKGIDGLPKRGYRWGTNSGSGSSPTSVESEEYEKLVRCCAMKKYDPNTFRSCMKHPKMECNGVEIDGQKTKCHKIETDHYHKGICTPYKKKCNSDQDCPKIGNKEKKHVLVAHCKHNICKYKDKIKRGKDKYKTRQG